MTALAAPRPRPGLVVIAGLPAPIAVALEATARELHVAVIDATPHVDVPPDPAEDLRAGIAAYESLRFDEAAQALDRAAHALPPSGGGTLATSELSDVYLYRGLARRQLGQTAAGWDDFIVAATLAPARVLDPARFPPRDLTAFGLARDAITSAPTGEVAVTGGEGCAIVIDGEARRVAMVPQGLHVLRAACPGQPVWGRSVTLASARVAIEVPPPPGLDDTAALIQARAASVDAVVVVGRAGAIVTLRVLASDGRVLDRATAREPADAARALQALVAPEPVMRPTTAWYRRGWVWGVTGAGVAAAVLLPFVLGARPSSVTGVVQLNGLPP